MQNKFPEPRIMKIDKDGVITFTTKQWKWMLKMKKCKAKTHAAQYRVIKKLVTDAIKAGLKRAKDEANANR